MVDRIPVRTALIMALAAAVCLLGHSERALCASVTMEHFLARVGVANAQGPGDQQPPFLDQTWLPSAFVYKGQPSSILLNAWPREEKPVVELADRRVHEIVWREPGGGLVVTWRAEVFNDTDAMEFKWTFANTGAQPTGILSSVDALSLSVDVIPNQARLIYSTGGLPEGLQTYMPGFAVSDVPLGRITLSSAGGMSSNRHLPFFVIHDPDSSSGIYVGIGWSGEWQTKLRFNSTTGAQTITAGMPNINLALPAGETIISPSVLIGRYQGSSRDGCNALRRTLYNHYVPTLGGNAALPPVSWNSWFVLGNGINESILKSIADLAAPLGIEYLCIDAGWFAGGFPNGVGNWTVDTSKFPNGLGPIGQYVAGKGMKLGLWFDTELVQPGTNLAVQHPDWVHNLTLDLGNPAARDWMFNMMSTFIKEGQVGWVRLDMNRQPLLPVWNALDTPTTQGLAQIRHVEGLYNLLDRLRAAFPSLLIEGCAGGGRRIDLETLKRSHTYWKCDETSNASIVRFQQTGGNYFLPGQMLNTNLLSITSTFDIESLFGGPLGFGADLRTLSSSMRATLAQQISNYKLLRSYLNKDYYPLFPQQRTITDWTGWQFHDSATGSGFFAVLRPQQASRASAQIQLHGVDPARSYTVTEITGRFTGTVSGNQLAQGWTVSLPTINDSEVFTYVPTGP